MGTALPSGAQCADWVRPTRENRPENAAANSRTGIGIAPYGGQSLDLQHPLQARVDGNFTGTTDELIQWASCKWGFDEDITRARVVAESYWKQSAEGDRHNVPERCQSFGKSAPCFESYGLLQVRPPYHPGTWPAARDSTAFNLDYAMAFLRVCFVGGFEWLGAEYRAGDEWGCVGTWFAGRWKTAGALDYNAKVQEHLRDKPWRNPTF